MGYQVSLYALSDDVIAVAQALFTKESRPTPSFPKFDTPWRDIFNAVWSIETTIVLEVSNISIKVS